MMINDTVEGLSTMTSSTSHIDLVQELYQFAKQHARASASQPFDADDYLQEILIVFLEISDKYQVPKSELIVIAKTAARNRITDLIRSRNVKYKYHVSMEGNEDSKVYEIESLQMAKDMIEQINKRVNSRTKIVLNHLKDGFSVKEVANMMGTSEVSVYRYIRETKMMYDINLSE